MTAQETPSLYDRLGGVYNIATVIDDLIDRVMADDRLNANPRVDEAHHRVSPAGFKYYVTEMACQAAGGPQQYSGRSMGDSHRHLEITEEEWAAFMDDLQQTMNKFRRSATRARRAEGDHRVNPRCHRRIAASIGDALTRGRRDLPPPGTDPKERDDRRSRRFVVAVPR